ncbi:hypothetical protein [Paenibacillus sp. FSL H8-0034]|uniref:hypothetical protein n=1 Tax=Paenibacillus sp. FSL H8-0034 TaxID=2954671 RepID=UPI0030F55DB1
MDEDIFGDNNVIEYPKKGAKLFQGTSNYYEFAHFGWGIKSSFYGFIKGYKGVSDRAVDFAVKSKDIAILDTHVFPIIFNYRQFLELSLKALYLDYSSDPTEVKKEKFKDFNHNLMTVWNAIEPMLLEVCGSNKEMVKHAKGYVEQFHKQDKSSFSFRYPITKQLEPIHKKEERFDLVNLKNRMEELDNYFGGADGALDYLKSCIQDQEEYRNEMRAEWEAEIQAMQNEARAEWEAEGRAIQAEHEAEARQEIEAEMRAETLANREYE